MSNTQFTRQLRAALNNKFLVVGWICKRADSIAVSLLHATAGEKALVREYLKQYYTVVSID